MTPSRILRDVLTFDRSAVEYGFAIRCAVGVALPLAVASAFGHPTMGFAAAIGALIAGFTTQQGIYRSRIATVLATTTGVAFASFIGGFAAQSLPALILVTAIVGYLYGTIAHVSRPYGIAAMNTATAFIIFSSLPLTLAADAQQALLLMLGGVVQVVLLVLVWPIDHLAIERRGLAAVYRQLAEFTSSVRVQDGAAPPMSAFVSARQILADPQPFARVGDLARFNRLLDDAEALRHRLGAVAAKRPASDGVLSLEMAQFLVALGAQLGAIADLLEGKLRDSELERVRANTQAAYGSFADSHANEPFDLSLASDIAAHLHDATQGASVAATGQLARFQFASNPRPSAYVEARIDWWTRDAIRLAVILSIAMVVAHTVFAGNRGYWIALTAALVLKPDLQSTMVRGSARILGTIVGAVIAVYVTALVNGDPILMCTGLVLAAAACYLTMIANYALFSISMTTFVLLFFSALGTHTSVTIGQRVLDTVIGGALAMIGYLVFPSWERHRSRPMISELLDAQRAFARTLLTAYIDPESKDASEIAALRTRVWKLRTEVESSLERARTEPHQPHTIDVDAALEILAASQSYALSSMALESGLETMSLARSFGEFERFREALDRRMGEVVHQLRERHAVAEDQRLDDAYHELTSGFAAADDAVDRFVCAYLGGYVQSVATLAKLVTRQSGST